MCQRLWQRLRLRRRLMSMRMMPLAMLRLLWQRLRLPLVWMMVMRLMVLVLCLRLRLLLLGYCQMYVCVPVANRLWRRRMATMMARQLRLSGACLRIMMMANMVRRLKAKAAHYQ